MFLTGLTVLTSFSIRLGCNSVLEKLWQRGFARFNEVTFCWLLQGVCLSDQTAEISGLIPPAVPQSSSLNHLFGDWRNQHYMRREGGQDLEVKTRRQAGKQWCCRCGTSSNMKRSTCFFFTQTLFEFS